MPLKDWIHRYPGVAALLQRDADELLDYAPDGEGRARSSPTPETLTELSQAAQRLWPRLDAACVRWRLGEADVLYLLVDCEAEQCLRFVQLAWGRGEQGLPRDDYVARVLTPAVAALRALVEPPTAA